jgi:hypothetical protein
MTAFTLKIELLDLGYPLLGEGRAVCKFSIDPIRIPMCLERSPFFPAVFDIAL